MPVTPNLHLELFAPLGVGWREDATAGALLDYDMMLIDAAVSSGGGGSAVSVNGALISSPNFVNSASVTFSVVGSNVSASAAGQVNSDWNAVSGVAQILNKPSLATVATSGSYTDLSSKPSIPAAQVQTDWNAASGIGVLLNKPTLATVATSGSYTDLSGLPTLAATTTRTAHEFFTTYNATTGAFGQAQPSAADLSDTATSAGYVLRANGTSFVSAQLGYGDLSGTPTIPTSFAWNVEGNANGNLSLSNAGYTSTFNQTSAVAWLWANTTTATVSTTNASPLLELAANCWHSGASTQDLWTIGSNLGANTDGSTLTFGHTGSKYAQTSLPLMPGYYPSLLFNSDTTGGFGMQSAGQPGIFAAGANGNVYFFCSNAMYGAVSMNSNEGNVSYQSWPVGGWVALQNNSPSGTQSVPLVSIGGQYNAWTTSNPITYIGVNVGTAYIKSSAYTPAISWASSVNGSLVAMQVTPTVNNMATYQQQAITSCSISNSSTATLTVTTGTNFTAGSNLVVSGLTTTNNTQLNGTWKISSTGATTVVITGSGWSTHGASGDSGTATQTPGTYTALKIAVTETSVPTGNGIVQPKLIDCYAGSSANTPMFSVSSVGTVALAGTLTFGSSADTGISRLGAASLAVGNGTAGDYSGSLKCAVCINKGFTVALLPSTAATGMVEGAVAYATNGLKVGETTGSGTGVPVYYSNGHWRVYSTDLAVAA